MQRIVLVLPFVSLLLAGCTSGSATEAVTFTVPPEPASSVTAPGELLIDAAELRLTIVDDAGLPLSEAFAAVMDLGLEAQTDSSGWATFSNLAPGTHKVGATKFGYRGEVKQVTIYPEESASIVFRLVAIPSAASFYETYGPLPGFFECRSATRITSDQTWTGPCGTVCPSLTGCLSLLGTRLSENDNSVLRFNVSSPELKTVVGDLRWTQSSFATSTNLRFALSHEGREPSHWWCSAQGSNPLQFRYEMEGDSVCASVGTDPDPAYPTQEHTLRMYANTPFGSEQNPVYVTFQQRFEMIATVFYGERAPEVYSGFEDV